MTDVSKRIAITGASGYLGTRLLTRLQQESQVDSILAIDAKPLPFSYHPKVLFFQHDIVRPLGQLLLKHRIDTVFHLAFVLRPGRDISSVRDINVGGTVNILDAIKTSEVQKLVYLSSSTVYGAHPNNPVFFTEESLPRPNANFQYGEDKVDVEALIADYQFSSSKVSSAVFRCCPIIGPNTNNSISRSFLKRVLVAVKGYDPQMQFVHEDDLANILTFCLFNRVSGIYNLAGEGTLRWSEMAAILGRKLVFLPAPLLYFITDVTWKLGLQSETTSSGLDFIRYHCMVNTDKIKRELGVRFRYSTRDAWQAFARLNRKPLFHKD